MGGSYCLLPSDYVIGRQEVIAKSDSCEGWLLVFLASIESSEWQDPNATSLLAPNVPLDLKTLGLCCWPIYVQVQ